MKVFTFSAIALHSLKEALSTVYWFKGDQKTFLMAVIQDKSVLAQVDWSDTKRNIASTVVQILSSDQARYQDDLLKLMFEICQMTDFSHLLRAEDSAPKIKAAKAAVQALKNISEPYEKLIIEKQQLRDRQVENLAVLNRKQDTSARLKAVLERIMSLVLIKEPQKRGYELEKILNELFVLFDLDPKAPFKVQGEQIDGAFSFEGTEYLLEAKWENKPVSAAALYTFSVKVDRKLDNTLGLFFSYSGFSDDAITNMSGSRSNMILMDSGDLMAVLNEQIDLQDLLRRKKQHASRTGEVFIRASQILS